MLGIWENLVDKTAKTLLIFNNEQRTNQNNAIINESSSSLGHDFKEVRLKGFTYCSQCRELIGGLSGLKCTLCKLSSHIKCLSYIDSRCVKATSKNQCHKLPAVNLHHFEVKTFLTFTYCHHCGEFIKGAFRQGKECLLREGGCGMTLHHDCESLVCRPCTAKLPLVDLAGTSDELDESDRENWSKISIEDFDLTRILGVGTFSKVYLAKLKSSGQEFAIKVLKKTNQTVGSDPESVFTEMRVLNLGRRHPFLTIVHCCFQSRERLFFVMEHVVGKNLSHYIMEGKFTEDRTRFHAAEIALALIFLHNNGVVYRDLKSDNVILDGSGHCKLLDFGMSKELNKLPDQKTRTFCGTPAYISPETIEGLPYSYSVDWWAFGVLIYEMLFGCLPFGEGDEENEDYDQLFKSITHDKVDYFLTLSEEARSLLEGLLNKDPQVRLGCDIVENGHGAIKEHPFFLFNGRHQWDSIFAKTLQPPYAPSREHLNYIRAQDGFNESEDDLRLTPIAAHELKGLVRQADFNGFSFYSQSFISSAYPEQSTIDNTTTSLMNQIIS